jgi:UDP-N-acetylmuramyl pentapeptide synthase
MGVEHRGDIKYFCSIVNPDIVVITSVSGAHLANFSRLEELQKEKISLIDYLKPNGKVIINNDDLTLSKINVPNILSTAVDNKADYRAETIKLSLSGTEFRIATIGHKISVKSQVLGLGMVYSQLFAFAVADILGCPLIGAGKSLEKISRIPGRMNPLKGKKETVIIDDTYNSNPTSAKTALDFLGEIYYPHRKVAILGNMNELGEYEKEEHKKIGMYARGKCNLAVFVGKNAELMKRSFGEEGEAMSFSSRRDFEMEAEEIIGAKDLILVKASQNNNFFEEIVKKLMAEPQKAKDLLVRQGSGWKRKKLIS